MRLGLSAWWWRVGELGRGIGHVLRSQSRLSIVAAPAAPGPDSLIFEFDEMLLTDKVFR